MADTATLTQASAVGRIKIRRAAATGALVYQQRGGNQTATDSQGISLDCYIHALFGLTVQSAPAHVLMIGCAGGTLATMLHRLGARVTAVDIDPVAFELAKRHFQMPDAIRCRVADGLAYLKASRTRFDAVIIDAFIGENVPPQFTGDDFCRIVRRRLNPTGAVLVNFCLDGRSDLRADQMARRFHANGWRVRIFDQPGGERNAIVLAGNVATVRPPRLVLAPSHDQKRLRRELAAMRFRRRKKIR